MTPVVSDRPARPQALELLLINLTVFGLLFKEYFPVNDENFMVDRKGMERYDELKQKRFGFWTK